MENKSVKDIFCQRPKSNTKQEENRSFEGSKTTKDALRREEADDRNPEYRHDVPFIITKVFAEIVMEQSEWTVCRRHYPFLRKDVKIMDKKQRF